MAKAKSKAKTIFLRVLIIVLAVLVVLGCVIMWVPGFWHRIDFFPQYKGILDSPITEITLFHGGNEVTFSDEDLTQRWEEGLEQLRLQKTSTTIGPPGLSGGDYSAILIQTESGEYDIEILNGEIGISPRCGFPAFGFTPNDWNHLPFEETYSLAAQRQGIEDH